MLQAPRNRCSSLLEKSGVLALAGRSSLGPHDEWGSCVSRNAGPHSRPLRR